MMGEVTLRFTVEVKDCPKDEAPFIKDAIEDAVARSGFDADVWRVEHKRRSQGDG